jgi:hypothetical protein
VEGTGVPLELTITLISHIAIFIASARPHLATRPKVS